MIAWFKSGLFNRETERERAFSGDGVKLLLFLVSVGVSFSAPSMLSGHSGKGIQIQLALLT